MSAPAASPGYSGGRAAAPDPWCACSAQDSSSMESRLCSRALGRGLSHPWRPLGPLCPPKRETCSSWNPPSPLRFCSALTPDLCPPDTLQSQTATSSGGFPTWTGWVRCCHSPSYLGHPGVLQLLASSLVLRTPAAFMGPGWGGGGGGGVSRVRVWTALRGLRVPGVCVQRVKQWGVHGPVRGPALRAPSVTLQMTRRRSQVCVARGKAVLLPCQRGEL